MSYSRRRFLAASGLTVAAASLAERILAEGQASPSPETAAPSDWSAVRSEFNINPDYVHLGLFFLVSHPRPVREAIDRYRRMLDDNPLLAVERAMFVPEFGKVPAQIKGAIAAYVGGKADEIALTGSTTEGLSLVYHGLPLRPGDEVLTTAHDHYVHHEAIRLASERAGASWRKIPLFDSFKSVSADGIVSRIRDAVRPGTRVVGVTWVHSSSGLKLPLRRIADALRELNSRRAPEQRILMVVDGVHGIGVEDPAIAQSGCDFFCAGAHKWLFAPRGTGFIWAPAEAWALLRPTIPSFESPEVFGGWMEEHPPAAPTRASWISPGGFHAFEHQWAMPAAFDFHRRIGPARITARIHQLNEQIKEGLAQMPHVELYTPRGSDLSAGIVCFDVKGMKPEDVVGRLLEKKVLASTTPYRDSYARLAAGIMNTPAQVEQALAAVRALAAA
jgi:selenocysteine lyase/cysteine desulfurase